MKQLLLAIVVLCLGLAPAEAAAPSGSVTAIVDEYIESWKRFQPSRALSQGFLDSISRFEDLSPETIGEWVAFNRQTMARLEDLTDLTRGDRIDRRLVLTQIRTDIERWQSERPHEMSLKLYADLIATALPAVLESTLLSEEERHRLIMARLEGVEGLAESAKINLRDGRPTATREALEVLAESTQLLAAELPEESGRAVEAISDLSQHVSTELLPALTLPDEPILGRDAYARKLAIYTDSDLAPERLEEMAWTEIQTSRQALVEMAAAYWQAIDPDTSVPNDFETLVGRAFDDLESNRPEAEHPYLLELRSYAQEVEDFVRDHEIATVPDHQTLSIELAPESSGPMARIGYVSSAPSFHPNPWTTWYLATIPDSHPEQERIDFWRSFNYSFKRFIVIHELFPGHYMQLKILRENPHRVRILFPYRPFIEGWATFTERIVLDAGYAEGDWLTRFAQLRKRLENANRAYTSVQAHCNGWSEQQVTEFSIDTSLLAPQFAKSLWGRLMRSPMQIITYMLVGIELREIYEAERQRLGEAFAIKAFMDTILRTGPVPSDELEAILKTESPHQSD